MRRLLPLLFLVILAASARADPTVSLPAPSQGRAVWTFSNPANYTTDNATLVAGGATLAWQSGGVGDTTQSDFAQASSAANVDVVSVPGDVTIENLSTTGPPQVVDYQPGPSQLEDTYLCSGNGGNVAHGSDAALRVGYFGNSDWNRILLRFPSFPLPANATLLGATLRLDLYTADTPEVVDLSVHAVTTAWIELQATWNDYDGSNPWNASIRGGDYNATVVDVVTGITNVTGWYEWNVTGLVGAWRGGILPNLGLMVRQIDDEARVSVGPKYFHSSDWTNGSERPVLRLVYEVPESAPGVLESRPLDAGGTAVWDALGWNASTPPGTAISIQTRTGSALPVDATWSAWSAPYAAPGIPIASPPGRYLQYRATLSSSSGASPVLHDVSASYERYAATGRVETQPFLPSNVTAWGILSLDATTPPGTSALLSYSVDGGAIWTAAAAGANLSAADAAAIALRLTLATNDTTATPRVHALSLAFAIPPPGGGGGGGGFEFPVIFGVPVWVLLIPFGVLAAFVVARDLRRPRFDATDAFLIHEDGRLIHHAGGPESAVKDDTAVSAMFTIVAQFVKDSFGGGGATGDLRNFQVDERKVVVGREGFLFLALVGTGTPPQDMPRNVRWFLGGVEAAHRRTLVSWDGLGESTGDVPAAVAWYVRRGYRRRFLWPRRRYRCG